MNAESASVAGVRLRVASPAQETQRIFLQVGAYLRAGRHGADEKSVDASNNSGDQEGPAVNERESRVGESGKHLAQVVSLLSDQPVPRSQQEWTSKTAKSPPDFMIRASATADEHAPQWLKTLLPEAIDGRWDVYSRDGGFLVKFCWRDQRRQTVTFPRISFDQFQTMKQHPVEQVGETLRAKIIDHLRSLLFDPEKRDKALAAAEKLGTDLAVPDVHNVHTLEIN